MTLVNHAAFGNFEPGDEIEVPDGAEYDSAYFHEKAEPAGEPESVFAQEVSE